MNRITRSKRRKVDIFSRSGIDKAALVEHIKTMLEVRRGETRDKLVSMYKKLNPGCPSHVIETALDAAIEEKYGLSMIEVYRYLRNNQDRIPTATLRASLVREFADSLTEAEIDMVLDLLARKME